ncbi:MAG: hypothetical protein ACI8WB_004782 [Phenylobacterium sp.]|jgi:hypothetical protein
MSVFRPKDGDFKKVVVEGEEKTFLKTDVYC